MVSVDAPSIVRSRSPPMIASWISQSAAFGATTSRTTSSVEAMRLRASDDLSALARPRVADAGAFGYFDPAARVAKFARGHRQEVFPVIGDGRGARGKERVSGLVLSLGRRALAGRAFLAVLAGLARTLGALFLRRRTRFQ